MKAYQYIALAAAALSFAACSQEDDFTPQGNQKDAPLTIASAGVAELTTRAAITNGNLEGGSIGVFVTSTSGGRYEGSNVKWTYNDGWGLEDATVVLFENNGEKQQIAAYYPYNENLGTGNVYSITLPKAYDENYEDFDYLYGASAPLTSNPATIGLNHLMTKVTVVVQSRGTELVYDDEVASIALVGVPRTADWTVPGATLEKYGDSENITLYRNGASHYGYALPNGAETLTLYITTESGRVFTATTSLDDKKTADVTEKLTSGMHYTIGVIVGKDKVKINSVSVEPWGDGGALTGGVAEEVLPPTVEMSGNTANITMPEYTFPDYVTKAVEDAVSAGATTIVVSGNVNDEYYSAIANARSGAAVYFKDLTTNNYISAAGTSYTCTVGSTSNEKYVLIADVLRNHQAPDDNRTGKYSYYIGQLQAKDPGARAISTSEGAWDVYKPMILATGYYYSLLGDNKWGVYYEGTFTIKEWYGLSAEDYYWYPVFDVPLS